MSRAYYSLMTRCEREHLNRCCRVIPPTKAPETKQKMRVSSHLENCFDRKLVDTIQYRKPNILVHAA